MNATQTRRRTSGPVLTWVGLEHIARGVEDVGVEAHHESLCAVAELADSLGVGGGAAAALRDAGQPGVVRERALGVLSVRLFRKLR